MQSTLLQTKTKTKQRFRQVVKVLVKYGFEDVISHLPVKKWFARNSKWVPKRGGKSVLDFSTNQRIRLAIEELGTSYIKFAQIAANRPDLLPKDLLKELSSFQDQVAPIDKTIIKQILQEEFPRPLDELFEYIDYTPLASASIAQVHRARSLGGREVVLKIQRPQIAELVASDIKIMKKLAKAIEKRFPQYAMYQPFELVKMFQRSIEKEIKFKIEAANIKRFQRQFKDNVDIYVPDVLEEYSTEKVLCMEYIEGIKITDTNAFKERGFKTEDIVHKGINLYFEQVFNHGFFHADPHPGNIFVLNDGKICFIDFGMMGSISEADKESLAELLLSLANRDARGLKRILVKEFSSEIELIDQKELEYYILDFFDTYSHTKIGEINVDEAVEGLNTLFFDFKIRVPPNLLLLLKAMVIIEGIGLKLYPGYNIIENIIPFAKRLLDLKGSSKGLMRRLGSSLIQTRKLIENFPEDVGDLISKVKEGKLHIEFEHKGLGPFLKKMEIVSNRLSFSMVLAAFIIGSSFIVMAKVPPFVYGISLLGVIGFGISGLLSLKLVVSILKHGNF